MKKEGDREKHVASSEKHRDETGGIECVENAGKITKLSIIYWEMRNDFFDTNLYTNYTLMF